ncbi:EVE domain-containing protein [Arenimonas maotaiensis]|uniref:EVE domain-containing protein n=1 Tax=Arenimonas maotaiensis TaxID=1446479 RepID=A0A917FMC8_9GAMM|nr:EVE domain-containing protein [Arenimonas maotaiensis]GGF89633.1 EVE domain-containing protein [Arenimonas maotaiensis]
MRYWLMKSEPDAFSIDDLARVGTEPWTGVRNYQARNFMWKEMAVGDGVLFYHSNAKVPGVVGVARVATEAYPDPTQFDPESDYWDPKAAIDAPRWFLVDVAFERKLKDVISLDVLRANAGRLGDFVLLNRGTRLSVLPVTPAQWRTILELEPK